MRRILLLLAVAALAGCASPDQKLRQALSQGTGVVHLPPGITELHSEIVLPAGASDLEIVGEEGSVLRASSRFNGRAILIARNARRIRFRNFHIDGNRTELERPAEVPPAEAPFVTHFQGNGILLEDSEDVEIREVRFREIPGFAVLASKCRNIRIEKVLVEESGSHNGKGRNNTTGGILLEEGTNEFEVRGSTFRKVLGNGVWTHSTYRSPRNYTGLISGNHFELIGRDAIQIGHANRVRVENNTGRLIGYPEKVVDVEGGGIPVAIDTAGKVDESVYTRNRFEEINGKCIDLDGFHDGEVSENVCINRGSAADYPHGHFALVMNNTNTDMQSQFITVRDNLFDGTKFGGIFVIGANHRIINNKLRNINKARCNESAATYGCSHFPGEPDLMQAGVYLGQRAERPAPARANLVAGNEVSGWRMQSRCVLAAPGISPGWNTVRDNRCGNSE